MTKSLGWSCYALKIIDYRRPQTRLDQTSELDGARCSFGSKIYLKSIKLYILVGNLFPAENVDSTEINFILRSLAAIPAFSAGLQNLIAFEDIAGVDLVLYIVEAAVVAVGDDSLALGLELCQVVDHEAAEEGGAIL